jgi:hypothetical protein
MCVCVCVCVCVYALQRHLGCSLLSALVTEYASTSGSSNIGLPLEFHTECKKAIEVLSSEMQKWVILLQ